MKVDRGERFSYTAPLAVACWLETPSTDSRATERFLVLRGGLLGMTAKNRRQRDSSSRQKPALLGMTTFGTPRFLIRKEDAGAAKQRPYIERKE